VCRSHLSLGAWKHTPPLTLSPSLRHLQMEPEFPAVIVVRMGKGDLSHSEGLPASVPRDSELDY
jgi:hypothetical protein